MKVQVLFILAVSIMAAACNNKKSDSPEQWSEEELSEWYSEGAWQHGFAAEPDESVNEKEMAIRYYRNPERWEKAFSFLAEQDLENLDPGRHELEGSDLFVMVTEYIPKDVDSAQFEAHRVYADIQYVVSGQEQIGIVPIDETVITTPYDQEKDIMFLEAIKAEERIATPDKFFVFFPNDAHRPSVKVNPADSSLVKKIVVKVKLENLPMVNN
jgi:YhcH/YjgK/YiaL family protein